MEHLSSHDQAVANVRAEASPARVYLVLAGLFARVRGVIETRQGALLIPQRAIAELQGDFRVFVVGEDGTVELRRVVRGPPVGTLQIIESGVAAGGVGTELQHAARQLPAARLY